MANRIHRRKMTHLFTLYDIDRNGFLDQDDFERIAARLCQIRGWDEQSREWAISREIQMIKWHLIRQFASPANQHCVSLDEFIEAYSQQSEANAEHNDTINQMVELTFDFFDHNGDGMMNSTNFADVYQVYYLDPIEAHEIFDQLDQDQDGIIPREDALRLVREFYISEHEDAEGNKFFGNL